MSMISSDMLYMIHRRLCEIFISEDLFGGKAILFVGDLMQLRPVKGKFIFTPPKNPNYKSLYQAESLWHSCEPIILKTNYRQGNENKLSEILNRARVGTLTATDIEILEQRRVHPERDKDIIDEAFHVFWTNLDSEALNQKKLSKLSTKLEIFKANIIAPRGYIPNITTYGTIDGTQYRKILKLKVGARVMLTANINIADSLINGSLGTVVDFIRRTVGIIGILVQFDNEETGLLTRNANHHVMNTNHPNATPISKASLEYYPRNQRSTRNHGCKIKLTQYPLRLSWASTCHKIQGITIPEGSNLVCNGHENIPSAMQYVMMSRVSKIENLYLSKNFDFTKVRCIKSALKEKEKLDEKFSQRIFKKYDLVFMNIRSLRAHYEDLLCESIVTQTNLLCFAETWMYPNEDTSLFNLPEKDARFSSFGKGKGCCAYYSTKQCLKHPKMYACEDFQIVGGIYNDIQIYVLYVSKGANFNLIVHTLKDWITDGPVIVIGDLNYETSEENSLSKYLYSEGLVQIVKRPTHIDGGIIDHCYISKKWKTRIEVDYFFRHYSDHVAICLTFPPQ